MQRNGRLRAFTVISYSLLFSLLGTYPQPPEPQASIAVFAETPAELTFSAPPPDEPEQPESAGLSSPDAKTNFQTGLPVTELLIIENSEERTETPTHLVIHSTSNVVADRQTPYDIDGIRKMLSDYGVSANYIVGRDGAIYLAVPEDRVAYHAGKGDLADYPDYTNRLNQYSIGIEVLAIGSQEEMSLYITKDEYKRLDPNLIGFTQEQYEALNLLIGDILERHPSIAPDREHVIGHEEYAPERKTDPGELFDWNKLVFAVSSE